MPGMLQTEDLFDLKKYCKMSSIWDLLPNLMNSYLVYISQMQCTGGNYLEWKYNTSGLKKERKQQLTFCVQMNVNISMQIFLKHFPQH